MGVVYVGAEMVQITIEQMMNAADRELRRLHLSPRTVYGHCKELREFADYCAQNAIQIYSPDTGLIYFLQRYGLDMADSAVKLTEQQRATRRTIRFLDDIYQFGCARRNSHHDYKVPPRYADVFENYLNHCIKNNGASGTIDVKRTKLKQFLCYLDGRGILLPDITASDVSDYMTTLCQYKRATIHIISSVLKDFFRYLHTSGILKNNLAGDVPRPKIYVEESFPETWTPEEIQQLLSVINRRTAIGKRDYAMILLAVLLGMRAGDICALKFKEIDWRKKVITYTQQKTGKINALPLLPPIGEAIIDYLKNGRFDSDCDHVFIRHIHPYGAIASSSTLSETIKRYMRQAGLTIKSRKVAHSMRHTVASTLLRNGVPLMTISNIMGHDTPKTTIAYTKVDIPALRKCALSYGARRDLL